MIEFLYSTLAFVSIVFCSYYLFGLIITSRFNLDVGRLENGVISICLSLVFHSLLGLLVSFFNLSQFVIPVTYFIGLTFLFTTNNKIVFISFDKILLFLCLTGALLQGLLVFPSGWKYSDGIRFYGVNANDGLWHTSLMSNLNQDYPPKMPTFPSQTLKNYHYFHDLLGAQIHESTYISVLDLNFRFLPFLYSLVGGLAVFYVTIKFYNDRKAGLISVFLFYFAGNFGFIVSLLRGQTLDWESLFWVQQSISALLNPPLSLSFAILFSAVILTIIYLKNKSLPLLILNSLIWGSLIGFKAYIGVLSLISLGLIGLYDAFRHRNYILLKLVVLSSMFSLVLLWIVYSPANNGFYYEPGWFVKTMMEAPDRYNNVKWELERQTFASTGNTPRLIILWLKGLVIFVTGNLGIRLLGFYPVKFKNRNSQSIYLVLYLIQILGLGIPLFLLQKGVIWNSIQFAYYSLIILNIFSAITIAKIMSKLSLQFKYVFFVLIVSLTIPSTLQTIIKSIQGHNSRDNYYLITYDEIELLSQVQTDQKGTILSPYHSLAKVSTFAQTNSFFENDIQAQLLGMEYQTARIEQEQFFCNPEKINKKEFLQENNILYIYDPIGNNCPIYNRDDYHLLLRNKAGSIYKI